MKNRYVSDIAFTPAVKKRQEAMGSRFSYQKMAERRDWQIEANEQLKWFLSERDSFYMGTSNPDGQPYIQHRGGPKGFLKVVDNHHLAFADFSGNKQYISVGNIDENAKVHIFLMDYPNKARIKIWGEAVVVDDDPALFQLVKDQSYEVPIERVIKIKITAWDVNCPQHIRQRFTLEEIEPQIKALKDKIADLEKQLNAINNNQK